MTHQVVVVAAVEVGVVDGVVVAVVEPEPG